VIAAPAARRQVRLAGPFQQLVLLALARLGPDTSAAVIGGLIQQETGRRISKTAVHTTLARLAARGYTRSWLRPIRRRRRFIPGWWKHCSDSELQFGARRFHTLQSLGRRALRLTLAAADVLRPGLPGLGREGLLYSRNGLSSAPPSHWWVGLPLNRRLRRLLQNWSDEVAPPEWLRLKLPKSLRPPPVAVPVAAPPAA